MRTSSDMWVKEYDSWYDRHIKVFSSELAAIRELFHPVQTEHRSIEIGVGTGRFAQALCIGHGADPSKEMLELARKRNIICVQAVAESLPFKEKSFDVILMVTVDCFLTDLQQAFSEVHRVLKTGGKLILGMIDRNSELGKVYEKKYEKRQHERGFYTCARLHSVEDISERIHRSGFVGIDTVQTLFRPLEMIEDSEPVRNGHGEGGFVVIAATKGEMAEDKCSKTNIISRT
ncbi:MAG: class I SAM-dependent methyltransferase [Methanomethylovorans sp.]|uniref:class I SAM-dependent methyltransferase n=1 Tax=Methanomethylovorans sp. TaxID=2758717 RepID=UPI000AB3BB29|nr:class I SAM-dependent methyltransferase [Methanomethylovorans sp.]